MCEHEKAIGLMDELTLLTGNETFAKECALLLVNELTREATLFEYGNPILVDKRLFYWQGVKNLIENYEV